MTTSRTDVVDSSTSVLDAALRSGLGAVVPVLGAHPQAGASGVALALADAAAAAGFRVQLIDSADPARSGLVGVCQVEGRSVPCGEQSAVRLAERRLPHSTVLVRRLIGTGLPQRLAAVPHPLQWAAAGGEDVDLTVVDTGWDLWQLMSPGSPIGPLVWCGLAGVPTLPVLAVRATAPSAALAEVVLSRYLTGVERSSLAPIHGVAVVGGERWPEPANAVMGNALRASVDECSEFVPADPVAAIHGWTTAVSPPSATRAAGALLHRLGGRIGAAFEPPITGRRPRLFRRF